MENYQHSSLFYCYTWILHFGFFSKEMWLWLNVYLLNGKGINIILLLHVDFALWFLFKRNKDKDKKLLLLHKNTHGSGFAIWFSFSIATKISTLM